MINYTHSVSQQISNVAKRFHLILMSRGSNESTIARYSRERKRREAEHVSETNETLRQNVSDSQNKINPESESRLVHSYTHPS